jgi:hypothetical protein
MTPAGLPHSDTPGSQLGCQLPRAYRRLQRPSSALDAKASTMCPSQLVTQTLNKNHKRHTPPPPNQRGSRATTKNIRQQPISSGRCQMLASTIHMSNTPPTNPTHQHTASRRRRGHRKTQPHPTNRRGHGPDSSGPNSVPKPHPHPAPPGSTPTTHTGCKHSWHQEGGSTEGARRARRGVRRRFH